MKASAVRKVAKTSMEHFDAEAQRTTTTTSSSSTLAVCCASLAFLRRERETEKEIKIQPKQYSRVTTLSSTRWWAYCEMNSQCGINWITHTLNTCLLNMSKSACEFIVWSQECLRRKNDQIWFDSPNENARSLENVMFDNILFLQDFGIIIWNVYRRNSVRCEKSRFA